MKTPLVIASVLLFSCGDDGGHARRNLPPPCSEVSDADGNYCLEMLDLGVSDGWLTVKRTGGQCNAISSLDAAYVLGHVVGKRDFDQYQSLACDVTGDGTCGALDASRILQRVVGKLDAFAATEACGQDWLWWPTPAPGIEFTTRQPTLAGGVCAPGGYLVDANQPIFWPVEGANFKGAVIGDVTGNWTECNT